MAAENVNHEVQTFIEENDVKFIRLQFCDIHGQSKNIAVSREEIDRVMTYGMPFEAAAIDGYLIEDNFDLVLHPDVKTIEILPWRPQSGRVARIICDIVYPDGRAFEADSRYILKKQMETAKEKGFYFKVGSECEFFLFKSGDDGEPTLIPADRAGIFDLAPYDKGENTRREIILTMEDMGFEIERSYHEMASGQHEIDFRHRSALKSADNMSTFKTVVKTIAGRNGLHASFLPKPLNDQAGNGMSIDISMEYNDDNIFVVEDGKMSKMAACFIAGILAHMPAITAFANPLVNSYKRLQGGWDAPNTIGWGYGKNSPLIRVVSAIPGEQRIVLRSPDPACNPYLTFALILAAGMEGIEEEMPLMPPLENSEGELQLLPQTLGEALEAAAADSFITRVLGRQTTEAYITAKRQEWEDYLRTVHQWEIDRYYLTY